MANPYRELFTSPGVKGLVLASAVARLPQAMIGIGVITLLVLETGHYWLAGAVAGTFTLANAFVGPQISRRVDRHGQSRVLPVVTLFSITMLLALIVAIYLHGPVPLYFILAGLAGTMPSMSAMIRARWMQLFRGKPQLHVAFSLDTVITEMAYIIGPPLAIGLSTSFFAAAGPLTGVVLLAIGVTAVVRQRETEPKVVVGTIRKAGSVLAIRGIPTIVLALLAMGVIGGSVDVAVVAFANAHGWPASASFILAAYAFGSLVAGLLFGALKTSLAIEKQFFLGVLFTAVTSVMPIFAPDVYILSAMLFVAGMSFAPTMVIVMNLGTHILPSSRITEGLTWMTTGISIGVALGSVLAGLAIDTWGARAGFGVPIVAGLVMLAIVMTGLRILRSTSAACSGATAQ